MVNDIAHLFGSSRQTIHNLMNQYKSLLGVYGVHAQKIIYHFMQKNGPDIFRQDNVIPLIISCKITDLAFSSMWGSMVNDIAHHFGSSRQTIHNLMNQYKSTGSAWRLRGSCTKDHLSFHAKERT